MDRQQPQQLLNSAQDGDRDAFDELVSLYRPRLYGLAGALLGSQLRKDLEIDDVYQEVCLRGFQSIRTFSWQGEDSLLRWFSVIARNVILEAAKRGRASALRESGVEAAGLSQSKALRRKERFDRLEQSLQNLSPEHRQVILLARIERLPLKIVAERMNRSHQAVRQLLRRALQGLKEEFGDTESLHLPDEDLGRGVRDAD